VGRNWGFIKAFLNRRDGSVDSNESNWITSTPTGNASNLKLALDIALNGAESTSNSSTTPLSTGATFTGDSEYNNFPQVGVMVKTDQPGTLFFDFSGDGTNWDSTFPTAGFNVEANIPEFHTAVKLGRYFRVRFINGTTDAQTFLRLYTYFGLNFIPSVSPVNQAYGLDADSTIVKIVPHWLQVNRELVTGITFINQHGKNAAASAGDTIEIGQNAITFPATAEIVNVVSTSTDDDGSPEGVGAFTILINGIDENFAIAEETVTLDGTTNAPTTTKFWFINTAKIVTASTNAGAIGTITMTSAAAGTPLLATIAIGSNKTQSANYMVPADCTVYFNLPQVTFINTNNNAQSQVVLYKRNFGGVDEVQVDWLLQAGATGDYQPKTFGAGLVFEEKSIIYWKIISVGTGTNVIAVDYDIWLVAD
jgi:hypothetical protein